MGRLRSFWRAGAGWMVAAVVAVLGLVAARRLGLSASDETLGVLTLTLLAATAYAKVTHDLYRQEREQLDGWRLDRRLREVVAMASAATLLDNLHEEVGKLIQGPYVEQVRQGEKRVFASSDIVRRKSIRPLEEKSLEIRGEARLTVLRAMDRVYGLRNLLISIGNAAPRVPEADRQRNAADLVRLVGETQHELTGARERLDTLRRDILERAREEVSGG